MTKVVQLLLEHGADVSLPDSEGNTSCKLTSLCGSQEVVELMSAFGAESLT